MIVRCIVFSTILLVLNGPLRFFLCELTPQSECQSIVGSPFHACTAAGYNYTLPFPKNLTESVMEDAGFIVNYILSETENCSQNFVGEIIHCAFLIPKCMQGKRELPCKRVCGEFLKQCEKTLPQYALDFLIASCHMLPDGNASSGNCFEPPNFKTNDSQSGPLDRGCQELILPACKRLKVYNHTFISVEQQKETYLLYYKKNYSADNAETDFPEYEKQIIKKFPECQENIKKLFCGEMAPPCFPNEGPGLKTVCRWVCEDIAKNCPDFFSDNFIGAEYCSQLAEGNSSSGFCGQRGLPPPFNWFRWLEPFVDDDESPTTGSKSAGSKAWVIILAVLIPLVVVGLLLAALFWLKWRRVTTVGYQKHIGEDDASPVES